ncbi:MAG: type II toxin-antitoxin system VapC family toxin [Nitrososphaerota archaeon]|nr:type II toxin-antitoxin system VapC family toxin [Nitrososphaerota archaeon]MDG6978678.1 type II toxin-antitoxin system VapC family toxin [Nitrososphaerota archaeon]
MIAIDSYGWIERFTDGPKAVRYNEVMDASPAEEVVTSPAVVYEIKRIKQAKGEEIALEAVAALSATRVVALDQTLVLEAADYSLECGLHMSDALVDATARHYGAELYPSEEDLRYLKSVTFI